MVEASYPTIVPVLSVAPCEYSNLLQFCEARDPEDEAETAYRRLPREPSLHDFKRGDVILQKLDSDAPASGVRLGINVLLQCIVTKQWRVFVADVKSAHLQAHDFVDAYRLRICVVPNGDIRERLQRMMGLNHDEILQMRETRVR